MSGRILQDLSEYSISKQLQVENLPKNKQIQLWRKQMDIITLSSRLQHLNNPPKCQQCIRKQQQIQTLIKALKALKSLSNTNPQTGNITYQQTSEQQVQSNYRLISQLQRSFVLTSNQSLLQKQKEKGKQKQKQGSLMRISKDSLRREYQQRLSAQDTYKIESFYQEQIRSLQKRMEYFQKKIIVLEETNRLLRQQILKQKQKGKKAQVIDPYGLSPKQKQINFKGNNRYKQQNNNDSQKKRLPTFSSVRASVTKTIAATSSPFMKYTATSPILHQYQKQSENTQKTKLLLEQYPTKQQSKKQRNVHIHTNNFFHIDTEQKMKRPKTKLPHDRKCRSIDNNLLEERKRSLNQKIRLLEHENKRLRDQFGVYY